VVEAALADGPQESFGEAFALGEATGVRIVSMPMEVNTFSKLAVNLVSRGDVRASL
jgi:hypothetical protein